MRMYDLIEKKKRGEELSESEIRQMIDGYTAGRIPDYQMSAFLMAVCFRGMSAKETADLTLAMRDSGDVIDLSGIRGIKVDKHSTGGVGDKTSIALAPLVSSVGVRVAKMSGRGLGHTGGTIDKLESIPGFTTGLTMEQFLKQVDEIGMAIMGQTAELAPADKKLYALRDVTATVDQLSLIASSIMSKKLASGADAIVLDVKWGSGAFMKKPEDARKLAEAMVSIGRMTGKKMSAFITGMDQPLGFAVGNALEVREAIDTLCGKGPEDFTKLCMTLGTEMVRLGGITADKAEAEKLLKDAIDSGAALKQLERFVEAQGGDPEVIRHPERLKIAETTLDVRAESDGYVAGIECSEVGVSSLLLGGGRMKKEDEIDLSVGLILKKKCGDEVHKGDVLATIYYNGEEKAQAAAERLSAAYRIEAKPPVLQDLILDRITE